MLCCNGADDDDDEEEEFDEDDDGNDGDDESGVGAMVPSVGTGALEETIDTVWAWPEIGWKIWHSLNAGA